MSPRALAVISLLGWLLGCATDNAPQGRRLPPPPAPPSPAVTGRVAIVIGPTQTAGRQNHPELTSQAVEKLTAALRQWGLDASLPEACQALTYGCRELLEVSGYSGVLAARVSIQETRDPQERLRLALQEFAPHTGHALVRELAAAARPSEPTDAVEAEWARIEEALKAESDPRRRHALVTRIGGSGEVTARPRGAQINSAGRKGARRRCRFRRTTSPQTHGALMSNAVAFLELSTGRLVEGAPPQAGFFVRGARVDDRFVPQGEVEGSGELGDSGSPGWMEISDGSFHGDQTARPPAPPFIRGVRLPSGEFRPTSRQIVR